MPRDLGDGPCLDGRPVRVGDRIRLWTLPTAGELTVLGLAGGSFVWVPNVENIPFVANVGHIVDHLPRESTRGWYVTEESAEIHSFDYDVSHPLMTGEAPRSATFFRSEEEAVEALRERLQSQYEAAAAEAARARRQLASLRERRAVPA